MCYNADTMNYVHKLGYEAELYRSSKGKDVMKKAGVYVVEMCKEVFQPELTGITGFESMARRWLQEYRKKGNRRISSGAHCEKIHSKQRYSSQQPALFSYLGNYGKTFQRAVRH